MKRVLLEYLPAWMLLMVMGLIVLHAPLTVWVGASFPALADVIKAWKEVLLVLGAALVAVEVTRRRRWREFLKDKLWWIVLAYAAIHLVAMVWSRGGVDMVIGLAIDLRYVLYFALVYAFCQMYPTYRQSFMKIGAIGAVVVMGFAVLQQFLPKDILSVLGYSRDTISPYLTVDENPDYIRINSTMRGPNPLGAYAAIVLAGVTAFWLRERRKLSRQKHLISLALLASAASLALWSSYSRSALVAGVIAVALVIVIVLGSQIRRKMWIGIGVIVFACGLGMFLARDTSFVRNVILHDNPSTGAAVDSNSDHIESLAEGTDRAIRQPFGAGIGSTGSASLYGEDPIIIENQYLFIAHEVGWLGLGLFIALYGIILKRLWQRRSDWLALGLFASGIGLALIGLLLPVWADDTVSLIWWGLAGIALTKGVGHGNTTDKKAKRTT